MAAAGLTSNLPSSPVLQPFRPCRGDPAGSHVRDMPRAGPLGPAWGIGLAGYSAAAAQHIGHRTPHLARLAARRFTMVDLAQRKSPA
jgi:hypothetical protein